MKSRAWSAVTVAALLAVASCANSTPEQTASSTSSSVVEATGSEETAPPVVAESAGAESECSAEEGLDAADTFDEAGLAAGAGGSRFVPLDDPEMVLASEVTWLEPDDTVMGVVHESGEVQAYPVSQMIYHHVANTSIAGEPYVVTY